MPVQGAMSGMTHLRKLSSCVDSGLLVVIIILAFLIAVLMTTFLVVKYEWCHVLFRNNTVRKSMLQKINNYT